MLRLGWRRERPLGRRALIRVNVMRATRLAANLSRRLEPARTLCALKWPELASRVVSGVATCKPARPDGRRQSDGQTDNRTVAQSAAGLRAHASRRTWANLSELRRTAANFCAHYCNGPAAAAAAAGKAALPRRRCFGRGNAPLSLRLQALASASLAATAASKARPDRRRICPRERGPQCVLASHKPKCWPRLATSLISSRPARR